MQATRVVINTASDSVSIIDEIPINIWFNKSSYKLAQCVFYSTIVMVKIFDLYFLESRPQVEKIMRYKWVLGNSSLCVEASIEH